MRQGYTRLEIVDVGHGATEHWWDLCSRLRSQPRLTGSVHATFDRTVYVEFDATEPGGRPALLAFGGRSLRPGPLLTRVHRDTTGSFRQLGLTDGEPCTLTVREGGNSPQQQPQVHLTIDSRIHVSLDTARLSLLPVGYPRHWIDAERFRRGTDAWHHHHRMLTRLPHRDGLGWLAELEAHCDRATGPTDRVAQLGRELQGTTVQPNGVLESLIGRGAGSTPAGDDLLCGVLVALHALEVGTPGQRWSIAESIVTTAAGRTTTISREMLFQAAVGRAAKPVRDGLKTLLSPQIDEKSSRAATTKILEIGHTSGCALLAGILTVTLALVPAVQQ